jgi:flagellar biosynthesis protein FlhG
MSEATIPFLAPAPPSDQASRLRALVENNAAPTTPRRTRVLTISSGKGGVGKTNACVNLAILMSQMGWSATLLDADLGMANADVLCGLTPTRRLEQFIGVSDRVRTPLSTTTLSEIAVQAPGGFRLIPGSVGVARMADLSAYEQARLLGALDQVEDDTELLVVDTGAGLGREVLSFIQNSDMSLIIATPEPTSIADAYALIKCAVLGAGAAPPPRLGLVVNQVCSKKEADEVHARVASVCERFLRYRLPLSGWVAQDAQVGAAVRHRKPLVLDDPRCPASRDLRRLACALVDSLELVKASSSVQRSRTTGLSGLWSRLTLRRS